jgi:hypothetical protein
MARILRTFLVVCIVFTAATASAKAKINDVYVIHLIIDGTNYNTMMKAVVDGKVHTLERTFFNEGAVFTKAISTFPSTSTSAYQSFITGLLPGHAGIPHLQRFDRQKLKFIDYLSLGGHNKINGDLINLDALQDPALADLDVPTTIFELLEGYPTLALYTSIRKGASIKKPAHVPLRAAWEAFVTGDIPMVDVLAFYELEHLYGGPVERIPRYALVGLYSSDISGHKYGAASAEVDDILVQFDYFLHDFLELLEKQGIRDKTYIIVSADHGMHDTGNLFRFREKAIDLGLAVKPKNPRIKDYNIAIADRGVSSTHVYTRRSDSSFAPLERADELRSFPLKNGKEVDLIDFVLSLEPTELLIVRDGERRVMVYDRDGNSSRISCYRLNGGEWCSYAVNEGANEGIDPLHFSRPATKALLDGRPHSSQAWKHATADEYYTDAVIQLGTIFQDGRAGDLFIVPKNSWGFRSVKKATHGSLIEADMHMPMFIAGPGVPRGTFAQIRTVDVFPLLLEWFGIAAPAGERDGVDPFAPYRGEDADWQALASLEAGLDVRVRSRSKLARLARQELERRKLLKRRIEEYIASLEELRHGEYLADHLAIARRIAEVTSNRILAMDGIARKLK